MLNSIVDNMCRKNVRRHFVVFMYVEQWRNNDIKMRQFGQEYNKHHGPLQHISCIL